jgi:hypothetical protein
MKKTNFVLGKVLITILTSVAVTNTNALKLSFNNATPLNMFDEVQYNINNAVVGLYVSDPIICHTSPNSVVSGLAAVVTDINLGNSIVLPFNNTIQYDLANQIINADVNSNQAACVGVNGHLNNDIIFQSSFNEELTYTIEYQNVPDLVVLGQPIDYNILVQNNSSQDLTFDVLEFVSENPLTNDAFFDDANVSWDCINQSLPNVNCGTGIIDRYGVSSVTLQAGEHADISVSRTVSLLSQLNEEINMLAAVFVTDQNGDFVSVSTADKTAVVSENVAPKLTWLNNSINTFTEDDQVGQSLSFRIEDGSGDIFTDNYVEDAILSYNNKVDISDVVVQENQSGVYDVSFTVTPQADKFTDAKYSEFISIQVNDYFNVFSNTLILEVEITAVNDAPSFDVTCLKLVLDPTPLIPENQASCEIPNPLPSNGPDGNYNGEDFFRGVSPGPYEDQTLLFSITDGTLAGNTEILDTDFLGGLTASSNLEDLLIFTNDGEDGEVTFKLTATDNLGMSYDLDTLITIEVRPVTYTISGLVNGLTVTDSFVRLGLDVGGQTVINNFDIRESDADCPAQPTGTKCFTFGYQLDDNDTYDVGILGSFLTNCSINPAFNGIIAGENVTDLVVNCGL